MKFRSKKTGEKYEAISHEPIDIYFYNPAGRDGLTKRSYDSLAELNEEWEDCTPAKPLIEDERIRKIIRAWADENDTTVVEYKPFKNEFVDGYLNIIGFNRKFNELYDKSYTIDELCGEEEE